MNFVIRMEKTDIVNYPNRKQTEIKVMEYKTVDAETI